MIHANDNSTPNRIRRAFRDDAVKAAQWLAAQPASAQPATMQSARAEAQPYLDYLAVAELFRPADLYAVDVDISDEDENTGFGLDYRHDMRPSPEAMIAAYADGCRCFVRKSPDGTLERFSGGIAYHSDDNAVMIGGRSSNRRFYGLHFASGLLVHYGQNGRRELALDEQTEPRGPDAANDNWVQVVRETTCTPGAPIALAEIDRIRLARTVQHVVGAEKMRLAAFILQADSFGEVAAFAGLKPTSHNGRRIAERTLREINLAIAA